MRVDFDKACQVVHLFCESMGIRAVSRLTGLDTKTVMAILEEAGQKAAQFLDAKVHNVKADFIQADELYSIVLKKEQHTSPDDELHGAFYTFLAVDRASKLIVCWRTDKRTQEAAFAFLSDLRSRVPNRFQLTTDNWRVYSGRVGVVRPVFGDAIDYVTETKTFASERPELATRLYMRFLGPQTVVSVQKRRRLGNPDMSMATTSHCERTNLSVRTFNRRFVRQTINYSKTLENLRHSVALFVWHFNFVRVHSAHKQTPAQAAGLTDHNWTIRELLESAI